MSATEGSLRHLQLSLSRAAPRAPRTPLPPSVGLPGFWAGSSSLCTGRHVLLRPRRGQRPSLVLPATKSHVQTVTTVSTVLTCQQRSLQALREHTPVPVPSAPNNVWEVTASLRRVWFCHEKIKGFLMSEFCWGLDDSEEGPPPPPPSYHPGKWGMET